MRPDWLDEDIYPFESHYFRTDHGDLHYVDEGSGKPVVMVHGNPTWSFLYRKMIDPLSSDYRCVTPDHLGFGLSDKPESFSYRPEDHAENFEALMLELDLTNVTLVCQDWGGPTSLHFAVNHPDRIRSIVVMNTFMFPLTHRWDAWLFSKTLGGPLGRFGIRYFNSIVNWGIPIATYKSLSETVMRHYREPFRNPENRRPIWTFLQSIHDSTPFLEELWSKREALSDVPFSFVWAEDDPTFGDRELNRWRQFKPDAPVRRLHHASHFLQEDHGDEIAGIIDEFLSPKGETIPV